MTEIHPGTTPPLPTRTPPQARTAQSVLALWREGECQDLRTLERIAAGLRNMCTHADISGHSTQHEVDGVIARWRAAHPEATKDRP
jgi:hypothetical protein